MPHAHIIYGPKDKEIEKALSAEKKLVESNLFSKVRLMPKPRIVNEV